MAKLEWDKTGERRIEAGVSNVALFPITNGTYGTGVAWSGVTAINEAPGGADLSDLYADNIKYASLRAAETFAFTIEAYQCPEEWFECDGSAAPVTGVYLGQQNRKAFGLVYKTNIGDDTHPSLDKGHKLHIIYNSTASPSSRGYATINDNPDAISMSWEASATPEKVTGYKSVSTIVIDSTKVDAEKLTALEATIYGSENADPTMPTPDQVIAAMGGTTPKDPSNP